MRRHSIQPRPNWQKRVELKGLTYHSVAGSPYWDESAYWELSSAEVDRIEAATAEIHRLCLAAGDHIIEKNRFAEMGIPAEAIPHHRHLAVGAARALRPPRSRLRRNQSQAPRIQRRHTHISRGSRRHAVVLA